MNEIDVEDILDADASIIKLPLLASLFALIGLFDSIYLTVKHFKNEVVPCSLVEGCEVVLNSAYAEIGGMPIAALGGLAYFTAFSLAILAGFGNQKVWTLFGILVGTMGLTTLYLLYLQAFVLGAFCQFCLISAATTFAMVIIFGISKMIRSK